MPVTMEAVAAVAHDTEHFSSIWVNVGRPDAPRRPAPPITSDPPDHHGHRRLLLPAFSPKRIAPLEDELRGYCRELIAALGDSPTADAAEQYSQHIPVHGICILTGLPEADADLFRDWIYRNFQLAPRDNNVRMQVMREMTEYIDVLLRDRQVNPQDDMLTLVANAEIDGEPVEWDLKVGYIRLMIVAGIDTTWSAIGSGLWHFAQHPDEVARLVAVPDDDLLWQLGTEEVLRYYAPVTMARKVIADTEVVGCPVHAGEQMLLTFPAANHDPAAFEDAHVFQLDREKNRHVAFGLGIHRCVGSNLARLELTVALQEWLRAFPNYSLDPARKVTWANGQVRGPRNIPVLLNR
jgi:cytochrome P450